MAGLFLIIFGLLSWHTYTSILAEQPDTKAYDRLSNDIQKIVASNAPSCMPFAHYEVSGPSGYRDPIFTHIVADLYYCTNPKEKERVSEVLESKGYSTVHQYLGTRNHLPEYYFEEFADVRDDLLFVYGELTP